MKISYWNCAVQKNWDGTLRSDMLAANILAYGKSGTGALERVSKPFLANAIEQENCVVVILTKDRETEYEDILQMAEDVGYEILRHNVLYCKDGVTAKKADISGAELSAKVASGLRFLLMLLEPGVKHAYNDASGLLRSLCKMDHAREVMENESEEPLPFNDISVLIDNTNWEVHIPYSLTQVGAVNICVTMDAQRLCRPEVIRNHVASIQERLSRDKEEVSGNAFQSFRKGMCSTMAAGNPVAVRDFLEESLTGNRTGSGFFKTKTEIAVNIAADRDADSLRGFSAATSGYFMKRFFQGIQTVVCTGASGMPPEEHRALQSVFFLPEGVAPVGGKFLLTELCAPLQPLPKAPYPKTVMAKGKREMEEYYWKSFYPGACVLEFNGAVRMYAAHDSTLKPMVFSTVSEAQTWLDLYAMQSTDEWPELVEMDACSQRYLLASRNAGGKRDEVILSYVQEDDIPAYVDQAMMLTMEVEEYLQRPELMSEVPDLAWKKEPANISLQKIANYACRSFRRVRKVAHAELPVNKETNEQVASMIETYRWRPYQKPAIEEQVAQQEEAMDILPRKRILFLGGHANMVKRLRQVFPDWDFLTDDEFNSWTGASCEVIFFWTNHCSHSIWEYVESRKEKNTPYLYVTATNISRLIAEMAEKYKAYMEKQAAAV